MKGVVIHKFWSDDFDMDLLRVFPNLPMLLGATAAIELWTVGHESYGRLNHPTCWDTPHGLTAFFWFQPPELVRNAHGWFWLDGGYVGNDQALRATWLEVLRDCWAHQYAISLEGRIVWDSHCKSSSCDWYADHAVLVCGESEITTTSVQAKAVAAAALLEALAPLDSIGKVYVLGTLTARGIRPEPPTVAVSGETVTLAYASLAALQNWPRETLRDVALVVQVCHAPGVEVPAVTVREGADRAIPAALRKWIE